MPIAVSAFYKFVRLTEANVQAYQMLLLECAKRLDVHGLLILSQEGCNATVSADSENMRAFKSELLKIDEFSDLQFKDSVALKQPFRRFKLDVRPEIVTFDGAKLQPGPGSGKHLTPKEWQAALHSGEDFVLIDTRNIYETEIGMFRGALDPNTRKFSDFTEYVEASGIPKDKKILMYCTGGIRCEKASLEMERLGYRDVFQLGGGILKYLEEFPNSEFKGECFVFDHRVAVDQELKPSQRYKLCPHCGNPADVAIICGECDKSAIVCKHCLHDNNKKSCSKNCAHHLDRKSQLNANL